MEARSSTKPTGDSEVMPVIADLRTRGVAGCTPALSSSLRRSSDGGRGRFGGVGIYEIEQSALPLQYSFWIGPFRQEQETTCEVVVKL